MGVEIVLVHSPVGLTCDTCQNKSDALYRVVLDKDYNAITKRPMWNCKECYERKNKERELANGPSII